MNAPLSESSPAEADRHRLVWASWPADRTTPVSAYLALRAAGHRTCLLESVEGPLRLARHSFVGVDPALEFRGRPGASSLLDLESGQREELGGATHEALASVQQRTELPPPPADLPPFVGGWIGWFSYEWASSLEPRVPLAAQDAWGVPEATFDHYRDVVAFDHAAQRLTVIAGCPGGAAGYAAARGRIERIAQGLGQEGAEAGALRLLEDEPRPVTPRADFEAGVERLRHAIAQGEIFQAVLSQRFTRRFEGDPFTLYRVLRLANPSPHMFFFEADGLALVGSSPERLVSVRGGRAEVVPIAGTRPRSADPEEDERLGEELLADEKERAEHDMLVDLARNDLGRVARIGSVQVKEYARLEKFQRVQHIVSRVEADLAPGRGALDALCSAFPAGTVSGAPKVRAMELVAAAEPTTRGPYAGAFGYLDGAGNLDVAISIRTLFVRGGTIHVQAGAGVVFDSDPVKEYEETRHKARALFDAISLADSPAFRPPGPGRDTIGDGGRP